MTMKPALKPALFTAALLAASCATAQASTSSTSINLSSYTVSGIYSLDSLNGTSGGISGLEASAVTFAKDRLDPFTGELGTLFFVGDEGTGVVEISRTGQTLGYMNFDWTGTGSSKHDTEGLAYLGNNVLVVTEERLFDAYQFSYVAGGTASLAANSVSIRNDADYPSPGKIGNSGLEGISYDARDGSYVIIKQESPEDILAGNLSFANGGGTASVGTLFNPNLMSLATLSDVQTLSPVDSLAGTAAADNLLVLSLGSRQLVEVTRSGDVLSAYDLSSLLNSTGGDFNALEGVTIDNEGNVYLVAEQLQGAGATPTAMSQLVVLTAPVPEPETYALMLAGLGLVGVAARRRARSKRN